MIYEKDYFGFVYIWYDKVRKKFLIGSHHGPVDDNYITSTGGKMFMNAYKKRPETFKRRILEYNMSTDNFRHTQLLEQKWLNFRPNISSNSRYYNRKQWAAGGIDISVPRTKPERWKAWKSRHNIERVKKGTHNFNSLNSTTLANKRVKEGTHHFLHSDFNKKPFVLYKNHKEIGTFTSKTHAVTEGWPAHLIDKLRKYGSYTTLRNSYKKDLFNTGDYFEYKNIT